TGRRDRRLDGLRDAVELAARQLVLQLNGDAEEEDREQEIGDPVRQREVQAERRRTELEMAPLDHGLTERQIGDDEAERGGAEEEERREALRTEKLHRALRVWGWSRTGQFAPPTRLP